jgi:hypothetical protein
VRRSPTVAVTALLALTLVACGPDEGDATDDDARTAQLEAELADAERRVGELEDEVATLQAELDEARLADDGTTTPDEADGDDDPGPDPGPGGQAAGDPQPLRSAEGLVEQLRTRFAPADLPDGWEPDATGWRELDPPAGLEDAYDTPGALAFDLAAALDADVLGADQWETTTRVLLDEEDPDLGYVAVLSWGLADDAVQGRDVRMTITRGEAGWSPGGAEERVHCLRGVTDDDRCV